MKKIYKIMIMQKIRMLDFVLLYPIFQLFIKQRNNEVLFLSDSRDDFSGNFEYVKKEIEARKKYNINGIFNNTNQKKKRRTPRKKFLILKSLAKAKYVFVDDFYPLIYPIKLKKGKKLIQLWHAMGAFKTVGYARAGKKGGPNGYTFTHRNYTGTIVSSESIRKDYSLAFGMDVEKVHALGIPRTDIFFDDKYKKETKRNLYKRYPKLKGKKVLLFAPTFRGNGKNGAYYDFDKIDFQRLQDELGDDYVCIIKLHPFIKNAPDFDFENNEFYLDLTSEREINNLLFVTDILITDYSSVIFEYSFFRKPLIFFTPDFDEYTKSRDFFYSFDKYNYGVRADTMDELIECIKCNKAANGKIDEFHEYFCSACDGHSTQKVVDYFLGEK